MYKRFRDGLLAPRDVLNYIGDKWYHVILQLLLFGLLMVIPAFVTTFTKNSFTYEDEAALKTALNGEVIAFHTENGILKNDSENEEYIFNYNSLVRIRLSVQENNSSNYTGYEILVLKDTVYISYSGFNVPLGSFNEEFKELKDFDFSKLGNYY